MTSVLNSGDLVPAHGGFTVISQSSILQMTVSWDSVASKFLFRLPYQTNFGTTGENVTFKFASTSNTQALLGFNSGDQFATDNTSTSNFALITNTRQTDVETARSAIHSFLLSNSDNDITTTGAITGGSITTTGTITGGSITTTGAITGASITDGTATLSGGELSNCTLKYSGNGAINITRNDHNQVLHRINPGSAGQFLWYRPNNDETTELSTQYMEYRAPNHFRIRGDDSKIEAETLTDGTATLSGGEITHTGQYRIRNNSGTTVQHVNPGTGKTQWINPSNTSKYAIYWAHQLPNNNRFEVVGTGAEFKAGSFSSNSDDRLKHNESDITNALATINKLKPQTYYQTSTFYEHNKFFASDELPDDALYNSGYIAQEVREISELSHVVLGDEFYGSDATSLGINYVAIQPYLCKAIQELHQQVIELHSRIAALESN
ncbi:MAG: tail fiber domain-containing protein [Paracoccaceae bacterium]